MSWRLSRKYLFGKNKLLPRATHLMSLIGVVIGVTALLIVSAVMNGLRDDMMNRIIDTKAEIRIYNSGMHPPDNYEQLLALVEQVREVTAVSPVINSELLIQKGNKVMVVNNFAIDRERHNHISNLEQQIRLSLTNEYLAKGRSPVEIFEDDGIIIGMDLSLTLGVTVGEFVRVASPIKTEPTPFGMLPKSKSLRVVGIFSAGMPEYDKTYTYISLANGRFFSGYDNEVDLLMVKIADPYRSAKVAAAIRSKIGSGFIVEDWSIFDSSLFDAMRLEKIVMLSVLTLMLVISGFNMACSSIRLVAEKQAEIGILKALGMKTGMINKSFMMINLYVGITGALTGLFISAAFILVQQKYRIIEIPVPGFPMQWLPVSPRVSDFVAVAVVVMAITFLTTIIPLHKISKTETIKVIRRL